MHRKIWSKILKKKNPNKINYPVILFSRVANPMLGVGEGVQSRQRSPKIDPVRSKEGLGETLRKGGEGRGGPLASVQNAHMPASVQKVPLLGKGELGKSFVSGHPCCTPPQPMMHASTPPGGGSFRPPDHERHHNRDQNFCR